MPSIPNIESITVLVGHGADMVYVSYDAPNPIWPFTGNLELKFEAAPGTGAEFASNVFGIEPTVKEI